MSRVSTTDLRVRGYECGPAGTVALSTALSYCELGRWNWILAPELGLLDELQAGSFFVVHRATLALARGFGIGTDLTVRAALRSVGRVSCEVEQDLVRRDGVALARARITAVWLGPDGRLRRVPDRARAAATDEALDARTAPPTAGGGSFLAPAEPVYEPRLDRLVERDVPASGAEEALTVRASDCDLHGHVNNAAWLRMFEDLSGVPAARADVEYRGQAGPGDRLVVRAWSHAGGTAFAALRGDDVLCRAVLTPADAAPPGP